MTTQCSAARGAAFYIAAPLGVLLTLMACSSAEDARPADTNGDGGDGSTHPDGGLPPESGDAATDAEDLVPPPPYDFAVKCAGDPCATSIAARGGAHACAVLHDGSVRCWGSNASGQLGTGASDAGWIPGFEEKPRPVLGISNAKAVAATGEGLSGTTCVVSGAEQIACFGSDASGQLGRGGPSTGPNPDPVPVEGVHAKSVTLASTFALAIGTDGRLWTWGTNRALQLARSAPAPDAGPVSTAAIADRVPNSVQSCAGTSNTGFVVAEDGAVLSWGGGRTDQLGRNVSVAPDPVPTAIAISEASSVATGAAHACALGRGRVFCWGQNEHGQLGTGRKAKESFPARVVLPPDVYAVAVAAGGNSTCIIAANGDVYCWGANGSGQLGASVGVDLATPTRIGALSEQAVAVAIMDDSICALLRGGSVACWGDNVVGQLGRGSRDAEIHVEPSPVRFE